MTLRDAIADASLSVSQRHAEVLLAGLLRCDRAYLVAHDRDALAADVVAAFRAQVARRAAGEPLQYITGEQEFYGLALRVSPAVLIPRPETELLVEAVLLWAAALPTQRVLQLADVGTGSGAIAVALSTHLAAAKVLATDISAEALAVAAANAEAHGCSRRITFVEADLLPGAMDAGSLDAVVSNPPYVPTGDAATMQPEVVGHEPHGALFAGDDGLEVYRRLIPLALRALRPGGLLAMEFGFGQREALRTLLGAWDAVEFRDDYAGIPRVVLVTKPK